jgi:spermidine synthase
MNDLIEPLAEPVSPGRGRFALMVVLFFLSGVAGLLLQVIWMYRLGLVFGNAAYATAATLSAFFLGLALGGWVWGDLAGRFRRPLAVYGLIEVGVALSALLLIPGLRLYETQYGSVVDLLGGSRGLLILGKFGFSTTLLLVPTFLMGGTFPVLASYIVAGREELARRGTLLYALNTLGASLGALLAGFFLLPSIGVKSAYLVAVVLAGSVGVAALVLDRLGFSPGSSPGSSPGGSPGGSVEPHTPGDQIRDTPVTATGDAPPTRVGSVTRAQIITLAVASGLLTLSAETLWTRMLAQVLQNSVYSFAAILVVFLIALGLGGLLSHGLSRTRLTPATVLVGLLSIGALGVGVTPAVFGWATDGLTYLAPRASWSLYVFSVFKLALLVVLPSTVVVGALFPFLLRAIPTVDRGAGRAVGRLVLLNSLGAAVGPVVAGFMLLDSVGLWTSVRLIAVAYGGLGAYMAFRSVPGGGWSRVMALPLIATLVGMVMPSPSVVRLEPGERLVETWQASDGVVSIVEVDQGVQLRLDNFYALGDSRSALVEQMQAHVPLLIHPSPERVLFLGLGTGITAGAALSHDVERVVAAELVPNVIRAARKYFKPWLNGLFEDSRVEVVADDARNLLLGTDESFDVIVGDLFTPWHAGTGSLYTVEHFRLAREKLAPGGIFAQWLPLYQLTPSSFQTIAATFASVFPEVTVWRADFSGSRASVALIGQEAGARLDQDVLLRNSLKVIAAAPDSAGPREHMAALFYAGNLEGIREGLSDVVLNTDDRRTVELGAPISSQGANAGSDTFVTGQQLEDLFISLAETVPPSVDPFLADLPQSEVRYAEVGLLYFRYLRSIETGDRAKAEELLERIADQAPDFAATVQAAAGGR